MVTDEKTYEVTGELTPDVTGTYEDAGEYNGRRYYQRTPNGWLLWWNGVTTYFISTALGVQGVSFWNRVTEQPPGQYFPQGDAIGEATVTEI